MISCVQESLQPDAEYYAKVEAKKRKLWKRLYTDLNRQAGVDHLLQHNNRFTKPFHDCQCDCYQKLLVSTGQLMICIP